VDDF